MISWSVCRVIDYASQFDAMQGKYVRDACSTSLNYLQRNKTNSIRNTMALANFSLYNTVPRQLRLIRLRLFIWDLLSVVKGVLTDRNGPSTYSKTSLHNYHQNTLKPRSWLSRYADGIDAVSHNVLMVTKVKPYKNPGPVYLRHHIHSRPIHFRSHAFEITFIWDLFIWDHVYFTPRFGAALLMFCKSQFYDVPPAFYGSLEVCKVTLSSGATTTSHLKRGLSRKQP